MREARVELGRGAIRPIVFLCATLHFKHRRKTIEGLRPLRRRVAAIDVQRMLQVAAELVRDGKLKIF
jgi:hypothetical protein